MTDKKALFDALRKFLDYQKDIEALEAECTGSDRADKLMTVLYGQSKVHTLIGGSNCKIFEDAMKRIQLLELALGKIWRWDLPETGDFWDEDKKKPVSYSQLHGAAGEIRFMKGVAGNALAGIG